MVARQRFIFDKDIVYCILLYLTDNFVTSCSYVCCSCHARYPSIQKASENDQEIPVTVTHCRPTHGTIRKSHITNTRHQEDKKSKATSSLFLIKMIAELERTQSNVQQNMEQTQNPTIGSTTKQQQHNHCRRTDEPFLV